MDCLFLVRLILLFILRVLFEVTEESLTWSPYPSFSLPGLLSATSGPGISVGIATKLRAGRSGIESRWERDFPPVQTDPGAHPASCTMGAGSFPGVKCGRGVLLTTHQPSSAAVMEE